MTDHVLTISVGGEVTNVGDIHTLVNRLLKTNIVFVNVR